MVIFQPHPVLFWSLKPNQDTLTKVDRKPIHINSHGTRGPDFDKIKPVGTTRIISMGDSRTFGWGVSDEETYSALLETLLHDRLGSQPKVEVINAGVNSWSYPQMYAYFRYYGLTYQPDYVILGAANTWTQFTEGADPDFVRKFMWSVSFKNFLRRFAVYHYVLEVKLENIYQQFRHRFIPVDPRQDPFFKEQQQKDPDVLFRAAIENLSRLALSKQVTPVLIYIPTQGELRTGQRSSTYGIKAEIASELEIPMIDLSPSLEAGWAELYLEADAIHLNAAGNRVVAEALLQAMERLIRRAANRAAPPVQAETALSP